MANSGNASHYVIDLFHEGAQGSLDLAADCLESIERTNVTSLAVLCDSPVFTSNFRLQQLAQEHSNNLVVGRHGFDVHTILKMYGVLPGCPASSNVVGAHVPSAP